MVYSIEGGNSTKGPIGFVATVEAGDPDEALAIFNEASPEYIGLLRDKPEVSPTFDKPSGLTIDVPISMKDPRITSLVIYINPNLLREMVIVEEDEEYA